jgi:hypothetical protein
MLEVTKALLVVVKIASGLGPYRPRPHQFRTAGLVEAMKKVPPSMRCC